MNQFIVFEGLSGTGKTTVAKLVARKIGAIFYKTPPVRFRATSKLFGREIDILARFLFYLSGVCQASFEIQEKLLSKSVVCDRYLLTTLCFHAAVGIPTDQWIPPIASKVITPHLTVLLTCDEKERVRRLKSRGLDTNDQWEQEGSIEKNFLEEYRKHRLLEVDNSSLDPRQACSAVLQNL